MDHRNQFEVIMGQMLQLPMNLAIDDIVSVSTVLVKSGYQKLEQLAGTQGNAWQSSDGMTLMILNAVVSHITRKMQLKNEQASIWARIESGK